MKPCVYTDAFISRFVDNEVSSSDHHAFVRHLAGCAPCAHRVASFRQLSIKANRHLESQAKRIQNQLPPLSVASSQTRGPARAMVLKLASLTAAAMVLGAVFIPWNGEGPEPSAIVNSVDTTGSSVMIIDTPDTRHTIIWFSET